MAWFLFQYSLLIPLMGVVNSTLLISALGIILVCLILIKNNIRNINARPLVFVGIVITWLLINTIFTNGNLQGVIYFIVIVLPVMIMFFFRFDYNEFLRVGGNLAILNFLLIFWNPFTSYYSYMRFGYGMLVVVIFAYIKLLYSKKLLNTKKSRVWAKPFLGLIFVIGIIEIIIYGARGAIFALILFIALDRFLIHKKNIIKNAVLIVTIGLCYLKLVPILTLFENIAKKIGIYSYSITKIKMQLELGIVQASSGRNEIYLDSFEKIKQHPVMGNGINAVEDGNYAHNLFLQVAQDIGVIALLILVIILGIIIIRICLKNVCWEEKMIYAVLFSIAVGRLMFSSTLWRRPEFWILMLFFIVNQSYKKHIKNIE